MTRLRPSGFGGAGVRLAAALVGAMLLANGETVLACPQCFGAEETSMIDGTRLGIAVLLSITVAVQGGFVAFFLYLRRRAKRLADADLDTEWSKLQRASRTS